MMFWIALVAVALALVGVGTALWTRDLHLAGAHMTTAIWAALFALEHEKNT